MTARIGWRFVYLLASALLGAGIALAFASAANAHTVFERGWTYHSDVNCTWGRADINHGNHGGGGSYAFTRSTRNSYAGYCSRLAEKLPGYIAVRYQRLKHTRNGWRVCTYTGWRKNNYKTHYWSTTGDSGGSRPSCGNGFYGTMGYSYVLNGSWYGGSVWSKGHTLPANG